MGRLVAVAWAVALALGTAALFVMLATVPGCATGDSVGQRTKLSDGELSDGQGKANAFRYSWGRASGSPGSSIAGVTMDSMDVTTHEFGEDSYLNLSSIPKNRLRGSLVGTMSLLGAPIEPADGEAVKVIVVERPVYETVTNLDGSTTTEYVGTMDASFANVNGVVVSLLDGKVLAPRVDLTYEHTGDVEAEGVSLNPQTGLIEVQRFARKLSPVILASAELREVLIPWLGQLTAAHEREFALKVEETKGWQALFGDLAAMARGILAPTIGIELGEGDAVPRGPDTFAEWWGGLSDEERERLSELGVDADLEGVSPDAVTVDQPG